MFSNENIRRILIMLPIFVLVEGGLGNQLFQASYGLQLSKRFQRPVRFVSLTQSHEIKRDCELGLLTFPVLFPPKIFSVLILSICKFLKKTNIYKLIPILHFEDDRKCEEIYWPLIVRGYWQNVKVCNDSSQIIRDKIKCLLDERDINYFINSTKHAVAIHIRRGDFFDTEHNSALHGVCSPKYYESAVKKISSDFIDPHFYIFSDDMNWVKSNVAFPTSTTFVESTKSPAFHDLFLMASCKSFIISNSTYSWWAARLAEPSCGVKIAPDYWLSGIKTSSLALADGFILINADGSHAT